MPFPKTELKKGKRPFVRDNNPKGKEDLLTKAVSLILIFGFIAVMAIGANATNNVLFFPYEFYFYAGLPIFLFILFLDWNGFIYNFKEMVSLKNIILLPFRVCLYLIASLISAYCFAIPFNLYIKESSKNNPIETYRCNIESILIKYRRRSDHFSAYYSFKNKTIGHNISREKAEALEKNDNYKKYYVHLEVRKGPFETYVVQDWQLRLKPNP